MSLASCTPSPLLCVCVTHIIGIIPCRLRNSLLLIEHNFEPFAVHLRESVAKMHSCQLDFQPLSDRTVGVACCRQNSRPFFLLFMISIFALISVRETENGTKNFSRHFILHALFVCLKSAVKWNKLYVCVRVSVWMCCACSLHRKCTRYA